LARKILLADDSVTAQNMGRKILADAGYEVITVNNGSAALKKIAEHKPDLIVLDVYMPGYSGLEVCQRLKEAQETARVPVLLTVGKLEPFKPEEAKRVRADGFIVKPFEASELLSALSKLEDKIVTRGEASKPGRFARATAALDEGRYDKTVALDEDSGWKNRIAFPSKKKEKAAPEDGEDTPIYNAMNKDLRTVVERKPADQPHEAKIHDARIEDTRVDLTALAPEGLPKDVTAEEIAALAAAAAQVKGSVTETSHAQPASPEIKTEATEHSQPPAGIPQEVTAAAPAAATFAERKADESKMETPAAKSSGASQDAVPSPADVMAAIAGLEPDSALSSVASSGNGSRPHAGNGRTVDEPTTDEPVTMAVAAGAGAVAAPSRWTAVSMAVAPDEAALSLELEMQKAYAAFAAAEAGHAAASAHTQSIPVEHAAATGISSQAEAAAAEPIVPVPATPAPEAAQTLSAVASAATEAISAAVKELEEVAASYLTQKTSAPVEFESAQAASSAPEPPQTGTSLDNRPAATAEPATETPKLETAKPDAPEVAHEEPKHEEPKHAEPKEEPKVDAAAPEVAPVSAAGTPDIPASANQISDGSAEVAGEPAARGTRETAKKESEMAETTAAAWASWRQIRESGAPHSASTEHSQVESSRKEVEDAAAMAVAAGAENHPEESSPASESDSEGIASIVDSVLADLRPKIFEEISRKMGKKK
jgi:two-component system chemotaxis response regulator CheY